MPAQRVDRRVDDRRGRGLIGVADGQENDVVSKVAQPRRLHMKAPSAGAFARNPID